MNGDDGSLGSAADDALYEAIFDAVMTRRLAPGARLTEATLCEIFGTTRAVVRRVFVRLKQERVIELQPNRGASVASPGIDETHAVFEARRVIEAGIVRKLAVAPAKGWLAGLRALVEDEHAAYERGDRTAWIELSGAFHLRLAEAAGNDELARMLRTLVARTSLMIALYQSAQTSLCANDEHVALLDAIERGDVATAIALSDEHLLHCERHLTLGDTLDEPDLAEVFAPYARARKPGRKAS